MKRVYKNSDCCREVRWDSLSRERLREVLDYCQDSGLFLWKINKGGTARIGSLAGWKRADGYVRINVDGKLHYAHRLAWLYVYGECAVKEIDHINGDAADNRIANLRLATHSENLANQKRRVDNKAGFKGVSSLADGTYVAAVCRQGQKITAGYFRNPQKAGAAYLMAATRVYGDFARES